MQIHELNNYNGDLDSGAYLAIDNGTDTGKVSATELLADTNGIVLQLGEFLNGRIDNIIAGGDAPSEGEIIDARYGSDGTTYPSLGDAIRGQISDVKSAIDLNNEYLFNQLDFKVGSIELTDGEYVLFPNNKARASALNITLDAPTKFVVKNGWSVFVYTMSAGGTASNFGQWFTDTEVVLKDTTLTYSFALKYGNVADLTSYISEAKKNAYYYDIENSIKTTTETVSDLSVILKKHFGWAVGSISTTGSGYSLTPAGVNRISVIGVQFDHECWIPIPTGWSIFVYTDDGNGNLSNWGRFVSYPLVHITDTTLIYTFSLKHGNDANIASYLSEVESKVVYYYKYAYEETERKIEANATDIEKMQGYDLEKMENLVPASDLISIGGAYLTGVGYHVARKVEAGEKYCISGKYTNATYPLYVIKGYGDVIAYHQDPDLPSDTELVDVEIVIPEYGEEIIVNGLQSDIAIKFYKKRDNSTSIGLWEYIPQEPTAGIMRMGGSINSEVGNRKIYPVTANEQVKISGRDWTSTYGCPAWLLLKDGVVVEYANADNMPESAWSPADHDYYEDFIMTIPHGVDTIVLNGNLGRGIRFARLVSREYEPRTKEFKGKTAVVWGTSIFSNTQYFDGNVFSIPSYAGMLLGMSVINEAVGASVAERGNSSLISADDPYGWTGMSWYPVFRSMGKSLAECQDLIDNYASKWYNRIAGPTDPLYTDAKPSPPLAQKYIDEIRADSYENKLIPYLDGTKPMPDLFIFEHGHNDFWNDGNYGQIPTDDNNLNMSSFMGAMSFYIRKIFEANKNAKVLIVSFYDGSESDTKHGAEIVAGQKALAEYQNVYFCDLTNTGWNQRHITTSGYWDYDSDAIGYFWIPSGGTERTITRREYAIPDDLHPHLDASGAAIKCAGEILADYIKNHITLD